MGSFLVQSYPLTGLPSAADPSAADDYFSTFCSFEDLDLSFASFKPTLIKTKQKLYVPDSTDHLALIIGSNVIL